VTAVKWRSAHALAILTLVVASSVLLTTSWAQSNAAFRTASTDADQAVRLIALASTAQTKAEQALRYAREQRLNQSVIDDTTATIRTGAAYLVLANATVHGVAPAPADVRGNLTAAQEYALEAMHRFHAAITMTSRLWEPTTDAARWQSLLDSIERHRDYIERVQILVTDAKTTYPSYDFSGLDANLAAATRILDGATANMTALQANAASSLLADVQPVLDAITEETKRIGTSTTIKGAKLARYIADTLEPMNRQVLSLASTAGKNVTAEVTTITATIETAKASIATEDLDRAMSAVREAYDLLVTLTDAVTTADIDPPY
jgi:aspartate/glutamate racemase